MGGYEQIGILIHSDHSCGETESYIEYYSQAVFDQFNDNSCIALNTVDKEIVLFSYSHYVIVNVAKILILKQVALLIYISIFIYLNI